MRRILDFLGSAAALVVLSPLMIVISFVVALTSPGGVFFRGERVGQYGAPFYILKFRSMVRDAEGHGKWNVGMDDPRVTSIGRFLRASKLDELPQFINVLRGDMSLVGPRPELRYYVNMYTDEESQILSMRPGITDWASLVNYSQYREFTQADDPDDYYLTSVRPLKLYLQLYQLKHQSVADYLRVLLWTAARLVRKNLALPKDVQTAIWDFESQQPTADRTNSE